MKKALALILAIMLMLSLCACQDILDEQEKAPVPSSSVSVNYDIATGNLTRSEGSETVFNTEIATPIVTLKNHKASDKINAKLNELLTAYNEGSDAIKSAALAQFDSIDAAAPYEYNCSVSVARGDTSVLSLIYDIYTYSGGDHGYTTRTARCFDTQTGNQLLLEDITDDIDTLNEFLYGYILNLAAGEKYTFDGESIFFEDFTAIIPELIAGDNWYFADDGLVVYADPYSIASFVQGRIDFVIPYSMLTGLVDEKYLPDEYEGENGMILAEFGKSEDSELKTVASASIDPDGEGILLSAEETVYEVTVSTVSGREVFYRNYLTTRQAVELTAIIPDEGYDLTVSYKLADGTVISRGISAGEEGSVMLVEIPVEQSADAS